MTKALFLLLGAFFIGTVHVSGQCKYAPDLQLAIERIAARQFTDATESLREIIHKDPACDPEEYHLLAIALLNLNRITEALDVAERGAIAFPAFDQAQTYFVSVVGYSLPKPQSTTRLAQAVQELPKSFVYRRAFAEALLDYKPDDEHAGTLLADCVRERPQDPETRGFYAKYLYSTHREDEAAKQIEAALAVTGDAHVRLDLFREQAALDDRRNQPEAARKAFEQAVAIERALNPPAFSAEIEYCNFLLRNGDDEAPRKIAEAVLARNPSIGAVHFILARCLAHSGEYERAIQEAQTALASSLASEQKAIHILLSKSLHAAGHEEEARLEQQWVESH